MAHKGPADIYIYIYVYIYNMYMFLLDVYIHTGMFKTLVGPGPLVNCKFDSSNSDQIFPGI